METENKTKKSKILSLICIILAVVLVSVGSVLLYNSTKDNKKDDTPKEETDVKKEQITPLVYEVTKEGSDNKIYLAGSMHVIKEGEFDYPKYMIDAYNDSDYLAVEFDINKVLKDPDILENELNNMLYQDETTIKDHISQETYEKLVNFLKENSLYNESLEVYNSYFFESLISGIAQEKAGIGSESGVDLYFLDKANKDKKEILEVESYEFQSNLLLSFPEKLHELLLLEYLDDFDKTVDELNELYDLWKKGDPNELASIIYSEDYGNYSQEEIELIKDYNYKLYTERNVGMKNTLVDYFENDQKVFFLVGAAHLVGEDGIANLLTKQGYTVTQINK